MSWLICLLGGGAPSGKLGHVDDLGVRRQLGEQLARCKPVRDDEVGLHQCLATCDRDQLGVARAAADQDHAGSARTVVTRPDRPFPQRSHDVVAHAGRVTRVPVRGRGAHHGHGDAVVAADGRGERSRRIGVVGPDAEDPLLLGQLHSPGR